MDGDGAHERPTVLLVNPMDRVRPEVVKLTSELVADGVDMRVLLPRRCRDTVQRQRNVRYEFYNALFVPNIRYTIPTQSFLDALRAQLDHVDIVHTLGYVYLPSLLTALIADRSDVRTVVTVDAFPGESWSYGNRYVDAVAGAYTRLFAGRIFGIADTVVGLGEYTRPDFRRYVDDERKVRIIPNGVDTSRYCPAVSVESTAADVDTDRGGTQRRYRRTGCDDDSRIGLLYVGRLDTVKGLPYLLEAVAQLHREGHRQFTLTVVGDGSRRAEWETLAGTLGIADSVTFEGWQDDVVEYYRSHDMLVLPSISEGLPTVITEAQACGTPVVSTDVGGAREQVRGGRIVPTKDAEALAGAIVELGRADLDEHGATAREYVEENYSLVSMSESYLELYSELAGTA